MPLNHVLHRGPLSRPWRRVILLLCAAGAIGGLGCATMLAADRRNPRADAHFNRPVLEDVVIALARPDAKLAKKIENEHAVAFLGKKHTYLLLEGGELLNRVADELDGGRVVLEERRQSLFIKDKTLWGTITLTYQLDPAVGSEEERLRALGFAPTSAGLYRRDISVQGLLYPPMKICPEIEGQFKQSRAIALFNPPDSSPPPDLAKVVLVPLAIAVDIALTPVYVGGLLILIIAYN